MQGKASRTHVEAAANCPEYQAKVIDEDGYTRQQIFNVEVEPEDRTKLLQSSHDKTGEELPLTNEQRK